VPIDYDPLLSKLIGYGSDRDQVISRLTRGLDEYFVGGIKTNLPLFRRILRDADFCSARLDTGFLDRMLKKSEDKVVDARATEIAAVAAGIFAALGEGAAETGSASRGPDAAASTKWKNAARDEALR
jgi:acetyl-CoA carboxylase biotin carboxylase subunit